MKDRHQAELQDQISARLGQLEAQLLMLYGPEALANFASLGQQHQVDYVAGLLAGVEALRELVGSLGR